MKKYYLHNGDKEDGPFDLEDLKGKNVKKETPVWCEGMEVWTEAGKVDELKELFKSVPPPFGKQTIVPPLEKVQTKLIPEQKSNAAKHSLIVLGILILFAAVIMILNNPNAIPGVSIEVNTPKPKVVTSRTNMDKSGLFKLRMTVYATIINQGGDGNVLVKFFAFQDGNTYDRTKSIYMSSNQSKDLDVTFDEVKGLGGKITYSVIASTE